jgi:hypothetical protein
MNAINYETQLELNCQLISGGTANQQVLRD